jgi:hypothetical protein
MRRLLVVLAACGGGGSRPQLQSPKPAPVVVSACVTAYADYEERWSTARSEELAEVGFDPTSIDEVIGIEVALLPTRSDLEKLRGQYIAVALFLPDAPWPMALDAAGEAIEHCGEEAPRP